MPKLVTLTVNPTIDVAFEVDKVLPTHKIRGRGERHDPGGGGINVARVFNELGGDVRCIYLAGGSTGHSLDRLVDRHDIPRQRIGIAGETRIAVAVREKESGLQYRLVADGPEIAAAEWQDCLDQLTETDFEYLVASGSLGRGMPDDFYDRVADIVAARGKRLVLDSSGRGLAGGLSGNKVFLVKPSLEELRALTGEMLESENEIAGAARALVAQGASQNVAVTLGEDGALLANADCMLRLPAIKVDAVSAVGSGDSFVAAMVFGLVGGRSVEDAFRLGVAAGAAAVMTPGTDLARSGDIYRLYESAYTP